MIKKVYFVLGQYGATGGTVRVSDMLAGYLLDKGYEVAFISHYSPATPVGEKKVFITCRFKQFSLENRLAKKYPGPFRIKYLAKLLFTPLYRVIRKVSMWRIARSLEDGSVIIFVEPNPDSPDLLKMVNKRIRSGVNIGTLAQFHSSYQAYSTYWMGMSDVDYLAKNCGLFGTLSPFDAGLFKEHFGREVFCTKNPSSGIEKTSFKTCYDPDSKKIVWMGRIVKCKRLDLLLKAFALVRQEVPGAKLEIWGSGSDEGEYKALAKELLADDSYSFNGVFTDPSVPLDGSSLFALTSDFEGLPLVMLEAISRGVPVVSTPASPAVVELANNSGVLCEDESVEGVAGKIVELLGNASLLNSKSNLALEYSKLFSLPVVGAVWEKLFEEALEKSKNKYLEG
ncbi:glycosyltransferase [Dermabacteraceae bacterium P7006]